MFKKLVKTRKFEKQTYKFYINEGKFDGEFYYYATCETPENGFGYSDIILLENAGRFNDEKIAVSLHRHHAPWIMKKIEKILKDIEKSPITF